jgi:CDP-glycerol glycerophosphotransferase
MRIVYNSFAGRYSDNPKPIYEELRRRHPDDDHVWLADAPHRHGFPPGTRTVPVGSAEARQVLESADLVVSNTHIELDWDKAPGAVYLQTWHGTPLKRVHFDVLWAPPGRLDYLTQDVRRWDLLLSPNDASREPLRRAFGFSGEVAVTGYPRNDVLTSPGRGELRARVRRELGIPDGKTVVLYTPTWRDLHMDEDGQFDFALHFDIEDFTARLGADHVLLLRVHYMLSGRLDVADAPAVRDVSFYPDIADLYLAADVMVTDYSSTMFDFAVTGKPILFFTYDLEEYRDTARGFYFELADIAPGPLLRTSADVVSALGDLAPVAAAHRYAYDRFTERFCHLEDGQATARTLDVLAAFTASTRAPYPEPELPTTAAEVA